MTLDPKELKARMEQRIKGKATQLLRERLASTAAPQTLAPLAGEPLCRSSYPLTLQAKATTLVIMCSSSRFLLQSQEFLTESLKIADYDLVAIPGGIQALALPDVLPKHHKVLRWMAQFLLDSHDLKRIICLAHEDCGAYTNNETLASLAQIATGASLLEHQLGDLRRARQHLAESFKVAVELYYAKITDGNVEFFAVT